MAETSSGNADGGISSPQPPNKVAAQLTKLRDANTKYKNLLKMAKERIEQQEEELRRLRGNVFLLYYGYDWHHSRDILINYHRAILTSYVPFS